MLEGRKQDTSPASHLSVNPFPHPKHSVGAGFQGAALWLLTAALEEKLLWTGPGREQDLAARLLY